LVFAAVGALLLAACSSGRSSNDANAARQRALDRLAPQAQAACGRYATAHAARADGAKAAGTAADVLVAVRDQHMSAAPWDHVDSHENVYLCALTRTKTCPRWGPIVTAFQRFTDDSGRSSPAVPGGDPRARACPT
jgi:hypothetical protein